jgi:hypothetical protein
VVSCGVGWMDLVETESLGEGGRGVYALCLVQCFPELFFIVERLLQRSREFLARDRL